MKRRDFPPTRGSNQSTATKIATLIVDDAITFIESGRVQKGVELLQRALDLLPDVGLDRQTAKSIEWIEKRGYQEVL